MNRFHGLLVPPRSVTAAEGVFRWPEVVVLCSPGGEDGLALRQLADDLKYQLRVRTKVVPTICKGATLTIHRCAVEGGPEAYSMRITPEAIRITTRTAAGAYYAVQTLRELLRGGASSDAWTLPCVEIADRPDFPRRGVYLDCSRGKVPRLATLKALVERLAAWKINELQLYIENVFTFARHADIGRGFSPLTPDEILALQDHCKLHHVRLVGSLASFGHMERILCLPPYSRLGELPGYQGHVGGTTLDPTNPDSIRLVEDLYEEFVPLHEAVDFNACCDETWELGKGRSKPRADQIGVGRLYLGFLLELHKLLLRHGKRMNVWADIVLEHPDLLGEVPRDIVMLNWDYNAGSHRIARTGEIAAAGLPFMVCPGTSSWQTHGSRLANAMGNVAEAATQGRLHGAEGLLNTDWGDSGHRNPLGASLHGFAHGAAHSWNGAAVDDATFTGRFARAVFGDLSTGSGPAASGPVAELLRSLGRSYVTCGAPHFNECALYHALVEPLAAPAEGKKSRIDTITEDGSRQVIADLESVSTSPSATSDSLGLPGGSVSPLPAFESLALEELALGARMDVAASRRALLAKSLRAGAAPSASDLAAHGQELRDVAADLQRLWLARNKPSRLKDNLELIRLASEEPLR